jgi:hypothetical protein
MFAQHLVLLDDDQVIELRTTAQHHVVARLEGQERDTGIVASPPIDWPAVEHLVRSWITLKHPW